MAVETGPRPNPEGPHKKSNGAKLAAELAAQAHGDEAKPEQSFSQSNNAGEAGTIITAPSGSTMDVDLRGPHPKVTVRYQGDKKGTSRRPDQVSPVSAVSPDEGLQQNLGANPALQAHLNKLLGNDRDTHEVPTKTHAKPGKPTVAQRMDARPTTAPEDTQADRLAADRMRQLEWHRQQEAAERGTGAKPEAAPVPPDVQAVKDLERQHAEIRLRQAENAARHRQEARDRAAEARANIHHHGSEAKATAGVIAPVMSDHIDVLKKEAPTLIEISRSTKAALDAGIIAPKEMADGRKKWVPAEGREEVGKAFLDVRKEALSKASGEPKRPRAVAKPANGAGHERRTGERPPVEAPSVVQVNTAENGTVFAVQNGKQVFHDQPAPPETKPDSPEPPSPVSPKSTTPKPAVIPRRPVATSSPASPPNPGGPRPPAGPPVTLPTPGGPGGPETPAGRAQRLAARRAEGDQHLAAIDTAHNVPAVIAQMRWAQGQGYIQYQPHTDGRGGGEWVAQPGYERAAQLFLDANQQARERLRNGRQATPELGTVAAPDNTPAAPERPTPSPIEDLSGLPKMPEGYSDPDRADDRQRWWDNLNARERDHAEALREAAGGEDRSVAAQYEARQQFQAQMADRVRYFQQERRRRESELNDVIDTVGSRDGSVARLLRAERDRNLQELDDRRTAELQRLREDAGTAVKARREREEQIAQETTRALTGALLNSRAQETSNYELRFPVEALTRPAVQREYEDRAQLRHDALGAQREPYRTRDTGGLWHWRSSERGPRMVEEFYRVPGQEHMIVLERRNRRSGNLINQQILTSRDLMHGTPGAESRLPDDAGRNATEARRADIVRQRADGWRSIRDMFGTLNPLSRPVNRFRQLRADIDASTARMAREGVGPGYVSRDEALARAYAEKKVLDRSEDLAQAANEAYDRIDDRTGDEPGYLRDGLRDLGTLVGNAVRSSRPVTRIQRSLASRRAAREQRRGR